MIQIKIFNSLWICQESWIQILCVRHNERYENWNRSCHGQKVRPKSLKLPKWIQNQWRYNEHLCISWNINQKSVHEQFKSQENTHQLNTMTETCKARHFHNSYWCTADFSTRTSCIFLVQAKFWTAIMGRRPFSLTKLSTNRWWPNRQELILDI